MGVESGDDLAVVLDGSVDSHDGLSGHSHVDVRIGAGFPESLDSPEGTDEVGVSGGGGGVEVESVGSGLDDPGGDVLDVPGEVLGSGLGGSHGLLHLELPQEVSRVSVGSVGGVVQSHVGHGTVEVRGDDLVLNLLHGLHLVGDDGFDRFDGVVSVSELECVGSQGPLVEQGGLEPSHVDSVSGVSVVTGEVQLSDVVGQDDLVSGLDSDDPVLVGDDLEELLHLRGAQCGNLSHVGRVSGSGLEVGHDLLFGHGDSFSVTHPCVILSHDFPSRLFLKFDQATRSFAFLVVSEADSP